MLETPEIDTSFIRTISTRGRKPQLPDTDKILKMRAIKRKSYYKNKEKNKNKRLAEGPILIPPSEFLGASTLLEESKELKEHDELKSSLNLNDLLYEEKLQQKDESFDSQDLDTPRFRLSAKRLCLTYSRVNNNVSATRFLAALKRNPKLSNAEILVCKEAHKESNNDEHDIHFHSLVIGPTKFNIRNSKQLDVIIDNESYHGHYKSGINNLSAVLEYIEKEKDKSKDKVEKVSPSARAARDQVSAGADKGKDPGRGSTQDPEKDQDKDPEKDQDKDQDKDKSASGNEDNVRAQGQGQDPTVVSTNDLFFEKLKAEASAPNPFKVQAEIKERIAKGEFTVDQALDYLSNHPVSAVGNISNVTKALDLSSKIKDLHLHKPTVPDTPLTLDDFNLSDGIKSWIALPDKIKPALILTGKSGCGKTKFLQALAAAKGWKTIIINVKDALSHVSPEHQMLIYDDYDFKEKGEELLSLFSREDKQLKIIYQVVCILETQILAFAMNYSCLEKLASSLQEDRFSRRIQIEDVPDIFLKESARVLKLHFHGEVEIYDLSALERERLQKNNAVITSILNRPREQRSLGNGTRALTRT